MIRSYFKRISNMIKQYPRLFSVDIAFFVVGILLTVLSIMSSGNIYKDVTTFFLALMPTSSVVFILLESTVTYDSFSKTFDIDGIDIMFGVMLSAVISLNVNGAVLLIIKQLDSILKYITISWLLSTPSLMIVGALAMGAVVYAISLLIIKRIKQSQG